MNFKPKRLTGYAADDLIAEIRRVVSDECNGTVPSEKDFSKVARVHLSTIKSKFGNYAEAVQKAGFTYTGPRKKPRSNFTPALVKNNLLEVLHKAGGFNFTRTFYREHGGTYDYKAILTLLGVKKWEDALAAIGVKKKPRVLHIKTKASRRNVHAALTENDLFKEIGRIWQKLERRPTYDEFRRESQYGISIYESRHGSWRKAIEAFCKKEGLRVQGKPGTWVSKELLLAELRSFQRKRAGDLLTYDYYKKNGGTYSQGVFRNHFGSWSAAVKAVGGKTGADAKYSKEELFDEMQRLWEKHGRQPLYEEMKREGRMSPSAYETWFGSWIKAVHAFCEDRQYISDSQTAIKQVLVTTDQSADEKSQSPAKSAPASPVENDVNYTVIVHKTTRAIPMRLRFRVMQRDNFTCKACGRSPAKNFGIELHVDHKVAYSKGGETIFENLQTLCKDCNLGKSNS